MGAAYYRLFYINFLAGVIRATNDVTLKVARKEADRIIRRKHSHLEDGKLPSFPVLKKRLGTHGEYTGYLTNGSWFHIQRTDRREVVHSAPKKVGP